MTRGLLTNSRAKMARLCAAKHNYRYNLGVVANADTPDLVFGTAIHAALEQWWRAKKEERLEAALSALDERILPDPYTRARALVMISGYHQRWDSEPLAALRVESEFRLPLKNPDSGRATKLFLVAGKIDAIVINTIDGTRWIMEHKTSSEDISPGGFYHRRLRIDSQVSTYFDGAAALGYPDIDGCIYDVLSKPSQRPHKATPEDSRKYTARGELYAGQRDADESPAAYLDRCLDVVCGAPEKYYARLFVPRLEEELHQARRDLYSLAQRINYEQIKNKHPRNPDACMSFGRVCEYFDVCTGVDSLSNGRVFRQLENPHQELSTVQPEATVERGDQK